MTPIDGILLQAVLEAVLPLQIKQSLIHQKAQSLCNCPVPVGLAPGSIKHFPLKIHTVIDRQKTPKDNLIPQQGEDCSRKCRLKRKTSARTSHRARSKRVFNYQSAICAVRSFVLLINKLAHNKQVQFEPLLSSNYETICRKISPSLYAKAHPKDK